MAHPKSEYAAQIKAIQNLPMLYEQDHRLHCYAAARSAWEPLFTKCDEAREAYASGEQRVDFGHDQLDALVTACQDSLLVLLPFESRERLRSQTSSVLLGRARNLEDVETLARAELTLRRLAVLYLKAASRPYRGEVRSPDWDRLLQEALSEFDAAEGGWEEASRGRPQDASQTRRPPADERATEHPK